MSTFHKTLRAFASEEIAKPGEHKRQEIAEAFMDAFPELARDYMRELAGKHINDLIKSQCDLPEADPLPLFSGFPSAITVAPGVVKATKNCTFDDLGAGLDYRQENVRNAQERLEAYKDSMAAFVSMRKTETETVGECSDRLREQGPIGEYAQPGDPS